MKHSFLLRVMLPAAFLLTVTACGTSGYLAAVPDLEKAGASAIAGESVIGLYSLKTDAARYDKELSLVSTRRFADACLSGCPFRVDTVRLLADAPEALSGAVRLLIRHASDASKRKLGKVVIPERIVTFGKETGVRFLLVYTHEGTLREREDRYDPHHSVSALELFLLDLQEQKVIYRGKSKMSVDPTLPENAAAQFRLAFQEWVGR